MSHAAALRHERLPSRSVLELRVDEMRQMFNAMDPAPFRKRDLDPRAEASIMDWAREVPGRLPLGIVVQLAGEPATPERRAVLSDARLCDRLSRMDVEVVDAAPGSAA